MRAQAGLLGGLVLTISGCAPLGTAARTSVVQPALYPLWVNNAVDCYHDRKLADEAWPFYECEHIEPHSKDFESGFKEGYADYLYAGGTGNPPPAPPRCYWNAKYETPEGHEAIRDWFAGFRDGAAMAKQSGYRELVLLPASPPPPPGPALGPQLIVPGPARPAEPPGPREITLPQPRPVELPPRQE